MPYVDISFNMESISDINELFQDVIKEYLENNALRIKADALGLDKRAGYNLVVISRDRAIGCKIKDKGSLEYYGGFEYIPDENRMVLGDFIFYLDHDRVEACLEYLKENNVEKS